MPAGKPVSKVNPPPVGLTEEKSVVLEDKVQLPRIMMVWLTPPSFQPGDAEMDLLSSLLTGGKNSRLYKRLVYELQIAQNVFAYQDAKKFASEFYIVATARPGVTLSQLEKVIQEEIDKLKAVNPDTNQPAEYNELRKCSDGKHRIDSYSNKFGRLAQGRLPTMPSGTDTIFFIHPSKMPKGRKATYLRIVCDDRPQKSETRRVRQIQLPTPALGLFLPSPGVR